MEFETKEQAAKAIGVGPDPLLKPGALPFFVSKQARPRASGREPSPGNTWHRECPLTLWRKVFLNLPRLVSELSCSPLTGSKVFVFKNTGKYNAFFTSCCKQC